MTETCPKCNSTRVERPGSKVRHKDTGRFTVWAYWNACLDCLYKWDGVTDDNKGILPALVKAREFRRNT